MKVAYNCPNCLEIMLGGGLGVLPRTDRQPDDITEWQVESSRSLQKQGATEKDTQNSTSNRYSLGVSTNMLLLLCSHLILHYWHGEGLIQVTWRSKTSSQLIYMTQICSLLWCRQAGIIQLLSKPARPCSEQQQCKLWTVEIMYSFWCDAENRRLTLTFLTVVAAMPSGKFFDKKIILKQISGLSALVSFVM